MTSIMLTVIGAQARATVTGTLTSGMVGIPITIEYDETWDGLTKNLMCRCSPWGSDDGEIRTRLNVGEASTVAHEVMQSDMYLYLGVEGFNADGTLVIPTAWANCGKIEYGANTCEDPSTDPELTVWNQIQAEMEQIRQDVIPPELVAEIKGYAQSATKSATNAERAKDHAVAASNEAVSNANTARISANMAQTSEENAQISANSAANLANGALQAQRAAEAAADRAAASADSLQHQGNTIFAGKTASFYGDSTTEENSHYGMGYHAWLKELLGLASYSNYGVSGYKIADVIAKVQSISDTAQVIFCKIGVNDVGGDTPLGSLSEPAEGTIYGGLNELCGLLRSKYPTRLVVFITPAEQSRYPSEVGVSMFDVRTAILEVCARHTIPVYDHYVLSGICSDNLDVYTTDSCHLNNTAHELLGKNLALYMRNTFGYLYGTVAVTGISLSASSGTLRVGESFALAASLIPSNATNKGVLWISGNPDVATVADGVVTAVAPGSARITAATEEGGYSAYYDLTVELVSEDITYYTITNELTNVSASNSTARVASGSAYSSTLTVPEGYTMGAVRVTMGGVDVTADVYLDGVINIPAVTGDVVMTASAAVAGAVNYVKSITSDGNQYLDTGIVPTREIVAEVDFQAVAWTAWSSIFGCEKGLLLSYQERDSGVLFAQIFGGNVYSTDSGMSSIALTDRHTAVIDCANKTWTIDGQVAHPALYIGTENLGNNMLVFARHGRDGALTGNSKTTLYSLKFSRGGETILDLRPCLDPAGVACMFDTVAQQYHYNLGTGEFTWEPLDA